MKLRSHHFGTIALLALFCCGSGTAQTSFMVRIRDLQFSKHVCTVVNTNGTLRREVTSIEMGGITTPQVFAGTASEDDIKRLKELVLAPDFQAAARRNEREFMIQGQGQIISVETTVADSLQTVVFADTKGQTSAPSYLAGFLSFADEVRHRKLSKVKGRVEPMCRPPRTGQ